MSKVTRWRDYSIDITGGVVRQIKFNQPVNILLVRNPDKTQKIYMSLSPIVSDTIYDTVAGMDSYGVIARPHMLETVYLFCTGNNNGVTISEIYSDNPLIFLQQELSQSDVAKEVSVSGTVGLKPGDLNIVGGTKNLVVDVGVFPGLEPVDLNIDGSKNLGVVVGNTVNIEPAGWVWQEVIAAGPGDITVKATSGKVAQLIGDGVIVQLKDGANPALKVGDYTNVYPVLCNTSIVVNFAAAGSAWILYR